MIEDFGSWSQSSNSAGSDVKGRDGEEACSIRRVHDLDWRCVVLCCAVVLCFVVHGTLLSDQEPRDAPERVHLIE